MFIDLIIESRIRIIYDFVTEYKKNNLFSKEREILKIKKIPRKYFIRGVVRSIIHLCVYINKVKIYTKYKILL